MRAITFTDKMIDALKPTDKKQYKSEGNGFTIRVMPTGGKAWLYRYPMFNINTVLFCYFQYFSTVGVNKSQ